MKWLGKISIVVILLSMGRFAIGAEYERTPTNYRSSTFWNTVRTTLLTEAVTVNFATGTYNVGVLNFINSGNADHKLTLQGPSSGIANFNSSDDVLLDLTGSRNIKVSGLRFSGPGCSLYAIDLNGNSNPCRDIEITDCEFLNLTNAEYGAIRPAYENCHDIIISGNHFEIIGPNDHSHAIYARAGAHDITIMYNIFRGISGTYISLRDRVSDVQIAYNAFTSDGENEEGGALFIGIGTQNDHSSESELFGDNFEIYGNTFQFLADFDYQCAIRWSYVGHEAGGYHQILNDDEADELRNGGPGSKRSILADAGIFAQHIYIYTNNYINETCKIAYKWNNEQLDYPPAEEIFGEEDVTNVFYQTRFSNDWETGTELNDWTISGHYPESGVMQTDAYSGHGDWSVQLYDTSAAYTCNLYRSIGNDIQRGYWRQWVRFYQNSGTIYPIYTNVGTSAGTIYWIKANPSNRKWGNNNGDFTGSPTWNYSTWYFLEMEFDFTTKKYTVWLNDNKIANNITIPTSTTTPHNDYMSGNLKISPASPTSKSGKMWIDFNLLGSYD